MSMCGARAVIMLGGDYGSTAEVLCGLEDDGHVVHEVVDKCPIVTNAKKPEPLSPRKDATMIIVWRSE